MISRTLYSNILNIFLNFSECRFNSRQEIEVIDWLAQVVKQVIKVAI